MEKLILLVILITFIFACLKEITEEKDSYSAGFPAPKDSPLDIIKKIDILISADSKAIKWRRSFISAVFSFCLIYLFIHNAKIPKYSDIVFYIFIIFTVYYCMWNNYTSSITIKKSKYARKNLKKLQDLLNEC